MNIAIWIIAICEALRMLQNIQQLLQLKANNKKINKQIEDMRKLSEGLKLESED